MTDSKVPIIRVYTDGSCLDNHKSSKGLSYGGYGCHIVYDNNEYEEFSGGLSGGKITNNVGELMALKKALLRLSELNITNIVHIYMDSTYVINTFSKWIYDWESNGWKKSKNKEIENLELIQEIYSLIKDSSFVIIFKKVKAHQPEPRIKDSEEWLNWYGNNRADELANSCATDMKESVETNFR